MIFKEIQIEGFGSIVNPITFKLDRPGVNVVIGENGNGKSTIFSALRWVISEKPLKKAKRVTTWTPLQPKDYKGAKVTLLFEKGDKEYKLTRSTTGKKTKVYLTENDRNLLTLGRKAENQQLIYDTIGFNDEVLVNSIIFGQKMKRLIDTSGPDKKKVFEEAFNATFLKTAKDEASKDLGLEKQKLNETEQKIEVLKEKYIGNKALINQIKEQITNFNESQGITLTQLRLKLNQAKHVVDQFNEKTNLSAVDRLTDELNDLRQKYYQALSDERASKEVRNTLNRLKHDKRSLESDLEDVAEEIKETQTNTCPTCGAKMSEIKTRKKLKELEAKKDKISDRITEVETRVLELASKLDSDSKNSLTSLISDYSKKIEKLENNVDNLKNERSKALMSKEQVKSIKASIREAEEKTPPEKPKVLLQKSKGLKNEIKALLQLKKGLKQEVNNLEWVVNDLLSNKGLKSYIFNSMLVNLNKLLAYYEQFIGFRVEFNVDIDSANKDIYTVCYKDDHLIYYEELSGGQAQLVDAVTAFALYDLITGENPTNLLVLDEPFESLSTKNTDLMYDLIHDKAKGDKAIFIITHLVSFQAHSGKAIRVGNKDGKTLLKML